MVKPLYFKGDKKPKKRKRTALDPTQDENDADRSGQPSSKGADADDDDTWVNAEAVTDVSGPVILVLPTDEPAVTCLACDSNGKVFASELENLVDQNPATAEPHNVQQVWVVNRVAGTESFSLKGHHGRYLSCDKHGLLSASAAAVSPEESFFILALAEQPGCFGVQTQRETFLSVDDTATPPKVRGDAELISFGTTIRIRMQARFKPRLKASKEEKIREKISRKELEEATGRRLEEDEVKILKRARKEGNFHEKLLDVKVKGKHDKFA